MCVGLSDTREITDKLPVLPQSNKIQFLCPNFPKQEVEVNRHCRVLASKCWLSGTWTRPTAAAVPVVLEKQGLQSTYLPDSSRSRATTTSHRLRAVTDCIVQDQLGASPRAVTAERTSPYCENPSATLLDSLAPRPSNLAGQGSSRTLHNQDRPNPRSPAGFIRGIARPKCTGTRMTLYRRPPHI